MATRHSLAAALVCASAAASFPATAQTAEPEPTSSVRIEFLHPEAFTDVGDRYLGEHDKAADRHLAALRQHIERRAAQFLEEGQALQVSITELDRAGSFEPWRRPNAPRIVRNVYPARIDLHFKLTDSNGAIIKEGERELRDASLSGSTVLYRDDPLRYEKALLDAWLEQELRAG